MNSVAVDDNLAILSLRAAQQIDRRLKDREYDPNVLSLFRSQISQLSGVGQPPHISFLDSEPSTVEIFSQAVETAISQPVHDIDSLVEQVRGIIAPLSEDIDGVSRDRLAQVKVFCLAFHKALITHWVPPLYERDDELDDTLRFG